MIAREVKGGTHMSKQWRQLSNSRKIPARTCKKSRFILSRIFVLIPPEVILARQRSLKTICISAPWAIISSIAVIWFATLYEARRSKSGKLL